MAIPVGKAQPKYRSVLGGLTDPVADQASCAFFMQSGSLCRRSQSGPFELDQTYNQVSEVAMQRLIGRRRFLTGAGAVAVLGALDGCRFVSGGSRANASPALQLSRLRASVDRITRITVCTRPFRAQGPRFDVEKVGAKTVVHN
jgi:hypothetical protein